VTAPGIQNKGASGKKFKNYAKKVGEMTKNGSQHFLEMNC